MLIPNTYLLEKYQDNSAYAEIIPGVYRNVAKGNYCLCIFADNASQYPMRDLLEMYRLSFTKGNSRMKVSVDGNEKAAMEVETKDDSIQSLIWLLNFATVSGKEVVNFKIGGAEFLCLKYGETNCTINGVPVNVPLLASREDMWGALNFEERYPEKSFQGQFQRGMNLIAPELPDAIEFRAVILRNSFAHVIYLEKHRTNKALMFNLQRYLTTLEGWDLIHALRGNFEPSA